MSKLRAVIVGCGGKAKIHAQEFVRLGVEIVGLCDVTVEIVADFIKNAIPDYEPQPPIYTDAAEMYANARPDVAAVITPHSMHYDQCVQAIEAGCHVLVEKPMVVDVDHARDLAARVEKAGKILVIGYCPPFTAEFAYLREQVGNGSMGKLELICGYLTQGWKPKDIKAHGWRMVPQLSGGGQAYDSGAHILSSLCWPVGSPVAEVHAFVDNQGLPVDVNSSINVRFENGVMGVVVIGGNCPVRGRHMTFAFDNGRIEIDGWTGNWINVLTRKGELKDLDLGHRGISPAENFIDAVSGRDQPRTTPADGIIQSELMAAVYQSARTGQSVRINHLA